MELFTEPAKRRSRIRRQSANRTILLSPRDIAVFKLLDRYRYLPSNFILAFVGGNPIRFKQRLGALFHEGYLNRPHRQWHAINARYRPAIYELDVKARQALAERGVLSRHRVGAAGSFAHEVMVCLTMASFELAAQTDTGLRFVSWPHLLANAPQQTRQSPTPFAIPVTIFHRDRRQAFDLKPDGRPFALKLSLSNNRKRALYFPGFELDRHTEPLSTADLERSSIIKKVLAYREMVASNLYKTHFDFPNMLVPFVTVNAEHMRNMIELVLSLTKGKGASYLLFKTIPDLLSVERTIEPDGRVIAEPWLRAGYPPFDIAKEMRAA